MAPARSDVDFGRCGHLTAGSGQLVTNNKILNTVGAAVGIKNTAGAPLDDFGDPSLQGGLVSQIVK